MKPCVHLASEAQNIRATCMKDGWIEPNYTRWVHHRNGAVNERTTSTWTAQCLRISNESTLCFDKRRCNQPMRGPNSVRIWCAPKCTRYNLYYSMLRSPPLESVYLSGARRWSPYIYTRIYTAVRYITRRLSVSNRSDGLYACIYAYFFP